MKKSRLKNITLSADEELIAKARKKATECDTTLNEVFRGWLEQFTRPAGSRNEYETLMAQLQDVVPGRSFSRQELNER